MNRRRNPYARPDARTLRARAAGYPARSVFKLEEIDRRFRLFKSGQRVLDLGAAPGSFSRYAGERVLPAGAVLAVDLTAIDADLGRNVTTLQADAFEAPSDALSRLGPYDVVLSDMAPKTSGSKVTDQAVSLELFLRALELAVALGKPGSAFVGKLFMSAEYRAARDRLAAHYVDVHTVRPAGTRKQSSEVYLVARGLRRSA